MSNPQTGHSAEECLLLKSAIANGTKDYLDRKNKCKRHEKKLFTTEEVNILLQAARSESVTRALKVDRTVTNPSRKVQFHTQSDLQEQVEKLKLYRDQKPKEADDSSDSEDSH